ncbi:MAG: xanthine dehydrogenase family protein molybdopterin-binding subunit [Betaproteobacteria bacterium]|nr:xanthine dehydrogenase family protein molybdopterin-binding subunit [Betaproteobacteria bacterium]
MTGSQFRFGSSDDARRTEDAPLLTGRGRFTDDLGVHGESHAAFVRAPVAHAEVRRVDVAAARSMPGVLAVITGRDLADEGIGTIPPLVLLPGRGGKQMFGPAMQVLAAERVRYVGEPVAIVVAETAAQAQDAADAVMVDFDELAAASSVASALASRGPAIWEEAPDNVSLDWEDGDAASVDAAFGAAAHVARVRLRDTRVAPSALEPRAAIGQWDETTGRYTLIACTQGVAVVRKLLAENVFRVPLESIRVLTYDVGGGFGMKVQVYPEHAALLVAAKRVERPVRWRASRLESFLGDTHGRDGELDGELALDKDGKFLALRARTTVGIGAYATTYAAVVATNNTKNCLSSVYRFPAIHIGAKMVLTNAAPLGPYRGAGRPEAIYLIERLIDTAARAMGIDRVELRRRNMIPPSALPYHAPNGPVYDSGEFESVMDKALALADWKGFDARKSASEKAGRLRGIGMCCFLEVAGGSPLQEIADLRFESDGKVVLRTGAQAMGQGQMTVMPRIVAHQLGIAPEKVRVIQGDSDQVPAGLPTVASRSTMMAGGAIVRVCDEAIEKGKRLAGHFLEAAAADLEYVDGKFRVTGTDRELPLLELAQRARAAKDLPAELAGGLDTIATFTTQHMSFPNGCHICEVEIDPETGSVQVVGYAAVDDVGNVLHETIVEGQIHGGVAQGLGQVLGEEIIYSGDGQLITASFMDYMLPRADELPSLKVGHHSAPCATNPLGVKGAGESGVAGSLPSAVNAVLDALAARGITRLDLPMTPQRVWSALHGKGTG